MGMNYYLIYEEKPPCYACCRPFETRREHIGKSSWGWMFSLHVIPELGINELDDWKREWSKPGTFIENEDGEKVSSDQLLSIITDRRSGRYSNSEEPMRHRTGPHCYGPGKGTYDLIPGEFS